MVFTAFHFLSVAWVKFKTEEKIDLLTLLLSTTLIDIEPFVGMFTGTYHGILHSFVGATVFSGLIAAILFILERERFSLVYLFYRITRLDGKQAYELKYVLMTSIFGGLSHVITDAFTHRNFPYVLFPATISSNPFWQGLEVGHTVQVITALLSLCSIYLWLRKFRSQQAHDGSVSN